MPRQDLDLRLRNGAGEQMPGARQRIRAAQIRRGVTQSSL
jgi:hypothetical protein